MKYYMRQTFFISFIAALAAGLVPAAAQEAQEDQTLPPVEVVDVALTPGSAVTLEAIEYYLNNIRTLRASFVQIAPDRSLSSGTFHFERPGRVRFEYSGDNPVLIVSDGNIISFIDYEIDQVTRWPVDETPLAKLLEDNISFDENVEISLVEYTQYGTLTALTTSDPAKPEQGTLTMIFSGGADDDPLALMGWEVIDAQGTQTTVHLTDSEINISLDDSLWEFDDPRAERFERRRRR